MTETSASATGMFPPLDTAPMRNMGRLLITCADRPGIVAAVCGVLASLGANVTDLQQYSTDPEGGRLFLRMEFLLANMADRVAEVEAAFAPVEASFDLDCQVRAAAAVKRIAIMVSKTDHALQELLWRRKNGDLRAEITMVVSNHDTLRPLVETWGIPFHYVPVTPETKAQAEGEQIALIKDAADTVVLARYMQILTPKFLEAFPLQAINIHHSFLPAFIGADPYARAAERGVKLIGATAHYVTADLDEGPIIEQDVIRIDHRQNVADLRRAGRYVERSVLATAVQWHADDRVIVHGNKTIVFT